MTVQKARARPTKVPDAAAVAAYLQAHPQFFDEHPEVLEALQLTHDSGASVSLIERQVQLLRRQLDTERHRLAHLIARARDYEALSGRLHALVLQIISAREPEHLRAILGEGLCREFRAESVALKLFPTDVADTSDPLMAAFQDFLDRDHALCGPLDPDKARVLFHRTETDIHTAALVPIRADRHSGVLAIGSGNPERFRVDMGTELLDRLGEIVSHKLHILPLNTEALVTLDPQFEMPDPARDPAPPEHDV